MIGLDPATGSSYLFAFIIHAAFYLSVTFQLCTKYDLMTLVFPESENASRFNCGEKELITYSSVSWKQFQNNEMEFSSILCLHDIKVVWIFSLAQVEHLLLGLITIFFANNTLISLLFAHSLCASGVRVNTNLSGLLGWQQLNTFNGNSD